VFGARHCDIRLPLVKRRDDYGDHKVCVDANDLRRVKRLYRNLRGIAGHNVKPYADLHVECPEIQFFTVLRDPVRRFLSHFLNRGEGNDPAAFDRWISANWVHNWQTKMIAGEPCAEKAIALLNSRFGYIGLTERFDESLVLLRQWLEEPQFRGEYRRVNHLSDKQRPRDADRKRRDMSYLECDEIRARIRAVNAEDQKVYDYVISHVYPRQVAAYRGDLAADVAALQELNRRTEPLLEPLWGHVMRNYVYKPLIHCHAA
jgi:hypothetical protein